MSTFKNICKLNGPLSKPGEREEQPTSVLLMALPNWAVFAHPTGISNWIYVHLKYFTAGGSTVHYVAALPTVKKATLPLVIKLLLPRSIRRPKRAVSTSSQLHPNGICAIYPKNREIDGGMGSRQITAISGSMLMSKTYHLRDIIISYRLYTENASTKPVYISWNQKIRLQGR